MISTGTEQIKQRQTKSSPTPTKNVAKKASTQLASSYGFGTLPSLQLLQQTLGNQAVLQLLQTGVLQCKLTISQPGDRYEQEADRVADQVMRMSDPALTSAKVNPVFLLTALPKFSVYQPEIQRQQFQDDEHEEFLQAKEVSGLQPTIGADLSMQISSLKGNGQLLSQGERAFFEPRFGYDFSEVRVHTDSKAAEMARGVNARAFTVGRDVVFGAGEHRPGSFEGNRLMAHELVHVVQQNDKFNLKRYKEIYRQNKGKIEHINPENALEFLLGPVIVNKPVSYNRETLLGLYKYLKEVRKNNPDFESVVKRLLNRYFPGQGENIWETSKKPLAGYTGTYIGSVAATRLKEAEKLGLTKTGWYKKTFHGTDVIFIGSHHWAEYPEQGGPGSFGPRDRHLIEFKKEKFVAPRVRLVIISSCWGLHDQLLKLFKKRFPNAYILGWRYPSPSTKEQKGIGRGSNMMTEFVGMIPNDLMLEDRNDINKILDKWEKYIEALAKSPKTLKPLRLGYATPDGLVKWYDKNRQGQWEWKTQ